MNNRFDGSTTRQLEILWAVLENQAVSFEDPEMQALLEDLKRELKERYAASEGRSPSQVEESGTAS